MMVLRAATFLLAGFVCVSYSPPAIAAECVTPQARSLMAENYRSNCVANIQELAAMLEMRKTKARDTETLAHVTYKDLLKCDFETDRLLKGLENPDGLVKTQKAINKMGLKAYIRAGEDLLSELRTKYNISDLEYRARSETGLWEGEVETLAKYAKTKANSDAVLAVLRACEN
jgi:hypothetical protein